MSPAREILVVDDDVDMTRTLSDILTLRGWSVTTAHSGEEAVEQVTSRPFAIVLMDVKMKGMTGVDALRTIRSLRPRTKVVLMTAYSTSELLAQAVEEGVVEILSKPLIIPALFELLDAETIRRPILVVDDNVDFLRSLCDDLEIRGIVTKRGRSLPEALDLLEDPSIAMVLLDLKLDHVPGTDSILAIREARPEVLLILFSGHPQLLGETVSTLPDGSVAATLTKPLDLDRLLRLLEELDAT